jgi:hypothetical protein
MAIKRLLHAIGLFLAIGAIVGLTAGEVWARGRMARGRPQIQRSGPASQGSFGRSPERTRRDEDRRAPAPVQRPMPRRAPEPVPEPRPEPRIDDTPAPIRNQRIDNVEDHHEDRRDDARRHRAWRHGAQLSHLEWQDYDCGGDPVEVDGDDLYECNGTWFIQTYYGGEVVYTATDPPGGH